MADLMNTYKEMTEVKEIMNSIPTQGTTETVIEVEVSTNE